MQHSGHSWSFLSEQKVARNYAPSPLLFCSKMSSSEDSSNDYFTKLERKKLVLSHMENGDWSKILAFYDETLNYREPLLVWIRPDLALLQFLESILLSIGISKITSIGCGCGFLEWLIDKATDLQVTGVEVNSSWWEGQHSTPHYIHLDYTEPGKICESPPFIFVDVFIFCTFFGLGKLTSYELVDRQRLPNLFAKYFERF